MSALPKLLLVGFSLLLFSKMAKSQDTTKFLASFTSDSLRLNSTSSKNVDTVLKVFIPLSFGSVQKGKLVIEPEDIKSANRQNIKVPLSNTFVLNNVSDTTFRYPFTISRDDKDDREVRFLIKLYDSSGKRHSLIKKDSAITIYVKPLIADSLTTNDNWEFWLFTGTNFDPFNGVKAQEFFFRANTLFKINKRYYGQIAFYKNRNFTLDSSLSNPVFQPAATPYIINGTDTSFRYVTGKYQSKTNIKSDPIGLQLDIMWNLRENEILSNNSSFLGTIGFDFSTVKTTIDYKYTFDTTIYERPSKAPKDTSYYSLPFTTKPIDFQRPIYNIGVGFMWILDNPKINIKAHFTAGFNHSSIAIISNTVTRSGSYIIGYEDQKSVYARLRMFATAKKIGISLGMESFFRSGGPMQFNFTFSKVFELDNFVGLFSPLSSLTK